MRGYHGSVKRPDQPDDAEDDAAGNGANKPALYRTKEKAGSAVLARLGFHGHAAPPTLSPALLVDGPQFFEALFVLPVPGARQAGPLASAQGDGLVELAGLDRSERLAPLGQLDAALVLAQWPEIRQAQLLLQHAQVRERNW